MLVAFPDACLQPLTAPASAEKPVPGIPEWLNEFMFRVPYGKVLLDVGEAALSLRIPMYVATTASCRA